MDSTTLIKKVEHLAEEAKGVDDNAAIVLFALAGSLHFYGASGLAVTCQDHAKEMLGRIAQHRRDNSTQ